MPRASIVARRTPGSASGEGPRELPGWPHRRRTPARPGRRLRPAARRASGSVVNTLPTCRGCRGFRFLADAPEVDRRPRFAHGLVRIATRLDQLRESGLRVGIRYYPGRRRRPGGPSAPCRPWPGGIAGSAAFCGRAEVAERQGGRVPDRRVAILQQMAERLNGRLGEVGPRRAERHGRLAAPSPRRRPSTGELTVSTVFPQRAAGASRASASTRTIGTSERRKELYMAQLSIQTAHSRSAGGGLKRVVQGSHVAGVHAPCVASRGAVATPSPS